MKGSATPMVFIIAPRTSIWQSSWLLRDSEQVTWRPRPLVAFYQMSFPVDWIKAKLAEGPIQRQDCDADPEDPDGEENVEDSPSE